MSWSLTHNQIQRCQPLLGTFVEVTIFHANPEISNPIITAAFEQIRLIERLMNVHDPHSQLSQLNATGHLIPFSVDPHLVTVLTAALDIYKKSRGSFDITGGSLLREGLHKGSSEDIVLSDNQVFFKTPLTLDLGGIAKGYAVDVAVEHCIHAGLSAGWINAGGDLRYWGPTPPEIWTRYAPAKYTPSPAFTHTEHHALATSFPQENRPDLSSKLHWNPLTPQKNKTPLCVTVTASTCMIADALTKVALNLEENCEEVLDSFEAIAYFQPVIYE